MEFANRIRKTVESSSLFIILGPQEGGKTLILKAIAKLLGNDAVVVSLKEKVGEWAGLKLPPLRPTYKPEDLVEWGLSSARFVLTGRMGHVAPWRQIVCNLLNEWGFKTPVCEETSVVESGLITWARNEFAKLKDYISMEPQKVVGGLMPIEVYVDIIAITVAKLANYIEAKYLIVDDLVAQLGRFSFATWALLHRNWFKIIAGQQVYYSRDLHELRELTTAADALCLTPLKINERARWKLWHLSTLKELRIQARPKNGRYVCLDDYGSYEVPFNEVARFTS